jgi:hypothetical protein
MALLNDVMPSVFAYQNLAPNGSILNLKRLKPAACPTCMPQRVHDNENAFIAFGRNGSPTFYCRRDTSQPLVLEPEEDEPIEVPVIDDKAKALIAGLLDICRERCTFMRAPLRGGHDDNDVSQQ